MSSLISSCGSFLYMCMDVWIGLPVYWSNIRGNMIEKGKLKGIQNDVEIEKRDHILLV